MILENKKWILFFIPSLPISGNALIANLRAPLVIDRYPFCTLTHSNDKLVVIRDVLEFNSDKTYTGNIEFSRIKLNEKFPDKICYSLG